MTVGARMRAVVALVLVAGGLGACSRPEIKLTPCNGTEPAIARVNDVAPPNCTGP